MHALKSPSYQQCTHAIANIVFFDEIFYLQLDGDGGQTEGNVKAWCYLLPQFLDKMLQYKPYLKRYRSADLGERTYVPRYLRDAPVPSVRDQVKIQSS